MGEVEFFSFDYILQKIETIFLIDETKQLIYLENMFDILHNHHLVRAVAQVNYALDTLTPAVDVATVRHHLDYVKTRLSQYIRAAEATLEIRAELLVAKENEIKTLEMRIQILEEENSFLKEKYNSPPPPQDWDQISQRLEDLISQCESSTIEELQEENQQLRLNLWSLNDRISGCEPSLRDYLRGRNWRAPEDEGSS